MKTAVCSALRYHGSVAYDDIQRFNMKIISLDFKILNALSQYQIVKPMFPSRFDAGGSGDPASVNTSTLQPSCE